MMKKCVIITTINKSTQAIEKHINNKNYDVIIVGDEKTSDYFYKKNCIFLSVKEQKKIYPKLSRMISFNHYARKNIGYLYAINKNYDVIYETDDDNIPHADFDCDLLEDYKNIIYSKEKWINIFHYFSSDRPIWPRGYPLSLISKNQKIKNKKIKSKKPSIINGLIENDPDVDSLFRLIFNKKINWHNNKKTLVSNNNICLFNSQNTFWVDHEIFHTMLLPSSVSFRYCDILRSIIANSILKKKNKNIAYISPNVTQIRNKHNLIKDFKLEIEMFISNETILELNDSIGNSLYDIYKFLHKKNIISKIDVEICKEWINNVERK
jgi:hypothetical protein